MKYTICCMNYTLVQYIYIYTLGALIKPVPTVAAVDPPHEDLEQSQRPQLL